MKKQHYTTKKGIIILISLFVLLLVIVIVSMNAGKMNLSIAEVFDVLLGNGTDKQKLIVFEFRLPRIVLAILVGFGMGASGCIMQSLLRNDMASPGTLGISSGSGLFVLLFVVFVEPMGLSFSFALPLLAFVGGLIAAALIFLLSYRRNRDISPTSLILTGVALSNGYSALSTLLTLKLDENQMTFMQRWNAGSLWGDSWNYIAMLTPCILILMAHVFYKSRILNTLNLGNQTAKGLGVAVKKEFLSLSIVAIALSSASVALGGNFFFVGMISPHVAKRLVGPNHKLLIPGSCLIGAIIIVLADTITRTISFGADIPTGIIITILSTPYFLYLLAKTN